MRLLRSHSPSSSSTVISPARPRLSQISTGRQPDRADLAATIGTLIQSMQQQQQQQQQEPTKAGAREARTLRAEVERLRRDVRLAEKCVASTERRAVEAENALRASAARCRELEAELVRVRRLFGSGGRAVLPSVPADPLMGPEVSCAGCRGRRGQKGCGPVRSWGLTCCACMARWRARGGLDEGEVTMEMKRGACEVNVEITMMDGEDPDRKDTDESRRRSLHRKRDSAVHFTIDGGEQEDEASP
ncbi:hypothetical protein HK101_005415, partial [Irineochytrium annulatum]